MKPGVLVIVFAIVMGATSCTSKAPPQGSTQEKGKQAGSASTSRFEAIDWVVIDNETNLMWTTWDNGSDISWKEANYYAETMTLGGHTDWRLPTHEELSALFAAAKLAGTWSRVACSSGVWSVASPPAITLTCGSLWTSAVRGSEAAFVDMLDGDVHWVPQTVSAGERVLPVRSRN